jgi:dipeptidyl aminopeptidase/acylaminoacyl peptidase
MRRGKPDLWLFSPDGSKRANLTNSPTSYDGQPHFSPSGRQIVFARREDAPERNGIWVCDVDGSNAKRIAGPRSESGLCYSPVWVSGSQVYYVHRAKLDQFAEDEVWSVGLDGKEPRPVFRFVDRFKLKQGSLTDVSPDGKFLAAPMQKGGWGPTLDVYVIDLAGRPVATIWEDRPDDWYDGRVLWSPNRKAIAWHHVFTQGAYKNPEYFGVGLAQFGRGGQWMTRLQPDPTTFVTPVAWSPDGQRLLCARMASGQAGSKMAEFFLMDSRFQAAEKLFELTPWDWREARRSTRVADWAILPPEVELPAVEDFPGE